MVFAVWASQDQIGRHEANNKARNAFFSVLALPEFEHVQNLEIAREIGPPSRDIMRALLMSKLDSRPTVESTPTLLSPLIQCFLASGQS